MILLKNGFVMQDELKKLDILIDDKKIIEIAPNILGDYEIIDCSGRIIFPGLIDVHVHLREPGFEYKETIKTGSMSAAKGGFTTIMTMPNLNPVPDSVENLKVQMDIINKDSVVNIYPYGAFTKGEKGEELADIDDLAKYVKAISDDGVGVNNLELLDQGMKLVKKNNLVIASHAEDNIYKTAPKGEYLAVEREIKYAIKNDVKYHFCHMSTKESFDFIREAKENGAKITCEVAPHHLFLNEEMINGNPNFKMNPPLRSSEDMEATIKALLDGTADIIASDHAPHSKEEKQREYSKCPNGIIGLETTLPLVYTNLIKTNKASLLDLKRWLVDNPSRIFNLENNEIRVGNNCNLVVIDIDNPHTYSVDEIKSKAQNSPYIGYKLYGWPILTICNGKIVYQKDGK